MLWLPGSSGRIRREAAGWVARRRGNPAESYERFAHLFLHAFHRQSGPLGNFCIAQSLDPVGDEYLPGLVGETQHSRIDPAKHIPAFELPVRIDRRHNGIVGNYVEGSAPAPFHPMAIF